MLYFFLFGNLFYLSILCVISQQQRQISMPTKSDTLAGSKEVDRERHKEQGRERETCNWLQVQFAHKSMLQFVAPTWKAGNMTELIFVSITV